MCSQPRTRVSTRRCHSTYLHSPTDLSEMLKEGTKESHDRAENTQFVKDFLKGRIKRELFKVGSAPLGFWGGH